MDYKPKDIVLVPFPYSDEDRIKQRPALILIEDNDNDYGDFLIAKITSKISSSDFSLTLTNWTEIGLNKLSYVRINKLTTINKGLIINKIGKVDDDTWLIVKKKFKKMCDLLV